MMTEFLFLGELHNSVQYIVLKRCTITAEQKMVQSRTSYC